MLKPPSRRATRALVQHRLIKQDPQVRRRIGDSIKSFAPAAISSTRRLAIEVTYRL